jgi:peptidoglycan/LPS O-acetylase OafA/YrhL
MVIDVLIAIGVAIVLTAIFVAVYGSTGPWPSFWIFFVIVLLAALAGGLWARPFGPAVWGVYWAPFLVFGLIIALVIAAAAPPRGRRGELPEEPGPVGVRPADLGEERSALKLGAFLWGLVVLLLVVVIIGMLV